VSVVCSLKYFGWHSQAKTEPKSIYAVFWRCICLYTTRFKPTGNTHISRDTSWTELRTPIQYSSRWLTKVQYSNNESLIRATLEHVVGYVFDTLRQGLDAIAVKREIMSKQWRGAFLW